MTTPCIGGIAYAFPETSRSLGELAAAGQLESAPALLAEFGFERVHVAVAESPYALAHRAAERLLAEQKVDRESIDLLIYGGAPGTLALVPHAEAWDGTAAFRTTERFKYPATRLQYELGLQRAAVISLDQLACTTLFGAVRIARALCRTGEIERALCVAAEFFPSDAGRESLFNCTSDAAVALLVERSGSRNRIAAATHVTKGYYWDADAMRNEIVASYFPTSKHVIERVIAEAGWQSSDVAWLIPHNVSRRSWDILLSLVRLPRARLWADNIARRGHALAGDNFINLRDALEQGAVQPGDKVVLFSYGYGAHWTALAVEA
ncbi:MAG TPA: 3-oxoacyl-[acyl-carrier-protein] synthase III C-terminal domain-containing protein [Gemmatimonadales bacterium]|jgi:3-oxoacyl-[acyl-carrier-protein] synthase-3|nr:3-oxoacyl-[acyl-carrier-protein] synthase III C-terminal domain-containing protein [Gemmatimonadales bacterium]